jgi:hypothetical protein
MPIATTTLRTLTDQAAEYLRLIPGTVYDESAGTWTTPADTTEDPYVEDFILDGAIEVVEAPVRVRITARGNRFQKVLHRIRSCDGTYDPDTKTWIVSRRAAASLVEQGMHGDLEIVS